MTRKYSVKAPSKRWPIHIFYNVIDLALINNWILFQDMCKSGISRGKFIQRVVQELTGTTPAENTGKNAVTQRNLIETDIPSEKKRKTCATIKCRNRTKDLCNSCRGTMVCRKCVIKICLNCVD